MYDKKTLLGLEVPALPKDRSDPIYRVTAIQYIIRARLALNRKVLVVAFYERESAANGFNLPTAVLYHTKDDYRTLLRVDGGETWRKGRISRVLLLDTYCEEPAICLRMREERTIRNFLRLERGSYKQEPVEIGSHINCYQTDILDRRLRERKARVAKETDAFMKRVPALPAAYNRWLERSPLKFSRYAYYQRFTRRKATCHCTHCRKTFVLMPPELPKHNSGGVCPHCKSIIVFKAMGIAREIHDEEYTAIIQRIKQGGYVLRFFKSTRVFADWETHMTESLERARLFFTERGKITGQYKWGYSVKTGRNGWYPTKDRITGADVDWTIPYKLYERTWNHWFMPSYLYPYNVRSLLEAIGLNYGIRSRLCVKPVNVTTYLMQSVKYPFEHLLVSQGMNKLVEDIYENAHDLHSCHRKGKLCHCLGLSKEYLPLIATHNLGVYGLNWLCNLYRLSVKKGSKRMPTDRDIKWAALHNLKLGSLTKLLHYTTFHRIRKYLFQQRRLIRAMNKLEKEKMIEQGQHPYNRYSEALSQRLVIWIDYVQMAGELGWDVGRRSVLFPKDLQNDHDVVQQLVEVKHNAKADLEIQALYPVLAKKYSFSTDTYLIRPPQNFEEYVLEGNKLMHCVAKMKYYDKHIAGTSLTLFIRRMELPDTPFYTVEYNPSSRRVLQCQGYRHVKATEEVQQFVDSWLESLAATQRDAA